ncbi:ketoacyl-synt-domain-containing protein [Rhizodiscina lignyota]|uniref:Ketoacyl-synt-domain-containing protein n=1 Tax=Rhizodiscina lignyota TaxID=1504668 RepID=A0A9P4I2E2_9PEZI|nr:ketoacyl-synt-domain-containing protein [Rhizodiscina lignyota]
MSTNSSNKLRYSSIDSPDLREPVAICGMATRLPGNIASPEELWDFLLKKKDARSKVPESRFNIEAFLDPMGRPGTTTVDAGYFLDPSAVDLDSFDLNAFSMTRAEVMDLDPVQRQLLEIVRECLESAGEPEWERHDTGCFVGSFGQDWADLTAKDSQAHGIYRVTGSSDFMLSNRISYEYDFRGPSVTFRTACSASMVALHAAVQALRTGDCSAAIVASANLITSPALTIGLSEIDALAPDASSKTFDESADGYARGEAVNAIYLKRLSDAITDGSPVRAIIRGTASNADGRTLSITNPNHKAQVDLIRHAYSNAGLSLDDTTFVELHGTGTQAGDCTESNAVAEVFSTHRHGQYIGSGKSPRGVKPNVGHAEGASGLTSIIASVLALEHKTIPPNIKFENPNTKIPFKKAKLIVPTEPTPWPANRYERVSINSFGLGGANSHVILDSAASFGLYQQQQRVATSNQHLLLSSGHSQGSTNENVSRLIEYIQQGRPRLDDLAFTLGRRRQHLSYRSYCVVNEQRIIITSHPIKAHETAKVVMVFTGQGAQYPGMGKELAETYPSFDNDLRKFDAILSSIPNPPSWSVRDTILHSSESSMTGVISQPLCIAIQIGLVNLLRSWGVTTEAVIGHSSGEIAAAYASGALSMADAISLSYRRGNSLPSGANGSMVVVGLPKAEVLPYMLPGGTIGCENSPVNITISGDGSVLDSVVTRIQKEKPQTFIRRLPVDMAYHSHHMESISHVYMRAVQDLQYGTPKVPMYSTTLGRKVQEGEILGAAYWRANLVQPVLFDTAIRSILDDSTLSGHKVFLEIGSHSALRGTLRQCFHQHLRGSQATYVATLVRKEPSDMSLLNTLGQLHCLGTSLALGAIFPTKQILTDLPPYSWNREKVIREKRTSNAWRHRKFPRHELLGAPVLEQNELEPVWRNVFRLQDVLWIHDHQVDSNIVFPAAGYVAIAGEAIRQICGGTIDGYDVRHLSVAAAIILRENTTTEIMTSLKRARLSDAEVSSWHDFTVSSVQKGNWVQHCWGQVRASTQPLHSAFSSAVAVPFSRKVSPQKWYHALSRTGLHYGPAFAKLKQISAAVDEHAASAMITYDWPAGADYILHPTALDLIFQTLQVADVHGKSTSLSGIFVPTYLEELSVRRSSSKLFVQANMAAASSSKGHGLRMSQLSNGYEDARRATDLITGSEMIWMPSLEYLSSEEKKGLILTTHDVSSVQETLEEMALLTMSQHFETLCAREARKPHLEKFRQWILSTVRELQKSHHPVWPGLEVPVSDLDLSKPNEIHLEERKRALRHAVTLRDQAGTGTGAVDVVIRIGECLLDIIDDKVSTLELLSENDLFGRYYRFGKLFDYRPFLKHLIHERPTCNILEIGAGTGSITASILPNLYSSNGNRLFSTYTFTDISEGFLSLAKSNFQQHHGMRYQVFDITLDPDGQGIPTQFYDLVIASNVVHATPALHASLTNVRKVLQPSGYLLLQELRNDSFYNSFVMGGLERWWLRGDDDREETPYVGPVKLAAELKRAGFAEPEISLRDHQDLRPGAISALLIARSNVYQPANGHLESGKVTIVVNSVDLDIVRLIENNFATHGIIVDFCQFALGDMPANNQDMISLLDIDGPFLLDINADDFERLKHILTTMDPNSHLLWCTQSSQFPGMSHDPSYAPILGLARSSRFELGIDFATLETDLPLTPSFAKMIPSFYTKYRGHRGVARDGGSGTADYEFAFANDTVHIGRHDWYSLKSKNFNSGEGVPMDVRTLSINRKGALQTLCWKATGHLTLSSSDVRVKVAYIGLNFRDLMVAMGVITAGDLGLEMVGTVVEAGPAVIRFKPGDLVVVLMPGCFGTEIVASDRHCVQIPDGLSFKDAASMYSVFCTSLLALIDTGRLRTGQSVLIHSACGGIGLAAIQLCQSFGVETFVTVGNKNKARYLQEHFKVPSDHIFDSHSTSFREMLLAKTQNRGVDLVLNSLAGELLQASWDCVADFGMLIELGKRDIQTRGKLDMFNFSHNRGYYAVDYEQILTDKPGVNLRIMERVSDFYHQGIIKPLPLKVFPAKEVEQCFRAHQKGEHIGKLLVEMPVDPSNLPVDGNLTQKSIAFDHTAAYLLVGGLGGIGRSVAIWMAEHGAKHIIFVSRSKTAETAKQAYANFFEELEALSCEYIVIHGDITVAGFVEGIINKTTIDIRGVLQLAMELNDSSLSSMTHEQWQATVSPKVAGTLNIHNAFTSSNALPLDFFVMFGSHNGLHGWFGQSNYAAANAFVDAFVEYRHRQGLAASVVDLGPVDDIGFVNERPEVASKMRSTFKYFLPEKELLHATEIAIARSNP